MASHERSPRLSRADIQAVPSRFPSPEPAAQDPHPPPVHVNVVPQFGEGENGENAMFNLNNISTGLFGTQLDVGAFNLDGFWEDFTLTDSGGFPFR